MNRTRQILVLILFLLICYAVAGIGSLFTTSTMGQSGWYATLPKPSWNPPNWVFGPVWTVLYTLIAIAGWLVWKTRGSVRAAAMPLALFTIQIILNGAWTIIFFGQHMPGIAFLDIVILWVFILLTMVVFWRIRPLAGWLFLPYLLWVTYASTLNYAIWQAMR
ncbi:MAG TPA: TspO/MBR family protein [Armatimonadota bacterium]|nr:TspO/MBR family protein [Armatimonadota bacterium]